MKISDYTFVMQTRQKEFDGFQRLYARFLQEEGPSVEWESIEKLPGDAVKNYNTLRQPAAEQVQNMLSKLVVVKLNGGLGTSMGCQGPKSVIAVRSDLTFLDLTVQQIEVSKIILKCEFFITSKLELLIKIIPVIILNYFSK
jgi:UDP-N-acetylglucosamine pyrophosphorylase